MPATSRQMIAQATRWHYSASSLVIGAALCECVNVRLMVEAPGVILRPCRRRVEVRTCCKSKRGGSAAGCWRTAAALLRAVVPRERAPRAASSPLTVTCVASPDGPSPGLAVCAPPLALAQSQPVLPLSRRPKWSKKSRSRKFCRERMRFAPPYSKRTQIGRHQWMTYCPRHDVPTRQVGADPRREREQRWQPPMTVDRHDEPTAMQRQRSRRGGPALCRAPPGGSRDIGRRGSTRVRTRRHRSQGGWES